MSIFDKIKARLRELTRAPQTIAQRSAPRIQAQLRADATTRRGNVPAFAPGPAGAPSGDIPITATAVGDEIKVDAPAWVMRKAHELGQPEQWAEIVREEARRGLRVRS